MIVAVAAVAAAVLLVALVEGDLTEAISDLARPVTTLVSRFGAPASLALLYIEESGVPLPVPGDTYVIYLGTIAGFTPRLLLAWLGIVAAVVAGASNLYLISRRWGPRLLESRLARLLELTPARLTRIERWIGRWGALTIIFGRHIPGFRIPITVMSGIFGVPYRVFAPSVAVSSAIWAAFWLLLAARFGAGVADLLRRNSWLYLLAVAVIAVAVAIIVVRFLRSARESLPREVAREVAREVGGVPGEATGGGPRELG